MTYWRVETLSNETNNASTISTAIDSTYLLLIYSGDTAHEVARQSKRERLFRRCKTLTIDQKSNKVSFANSIFSPSTCHFSESAVRRDGVLAIRDRSELVGSGGGDEHF